MVCNAGLYYIHVRKRTCGDTVLKNIFNRCLLFRCLDADGAALCRICVAV